MSAFDLPEEPREINGGATAYDIRQMYPTTASVTNARPGVTGAAVGTTTFQWEDSNLHWVPSLSYFVIRGRFLDPTNSLARTSGIAYCDNWPAALFSQIGFMCGSTSVELLQSPPQADTALLYSSVDRTWLKSFGSASGVGESFQQRCLNSAQFGTAAVGTTNQNEVTCTWRPSLSIFDCAHAIPPLGSAGKMQIDFSWNPTAEQNMIESIASATAVSGFTFTIDEFTFYKATLKPSPEKPLPMRGLVELNPAQVNCFSLTGGNTLNVQIPLPATCNRILVVMQDNQTAQNFAAGQNGLKPITSFAAAVSSGATDFSSYITNMQVQFQDLGTSAPNPQYSFTAGSSNGAKTGLERAYADWIAICRGASGGYEGAIQFGCYDSGIGAQINTPLQTVTPVVQAGNLVDNDQGYAHWSAATTAVAATAYSDKARFGWLGRVPGPIFAFPCVRPKGTTVSRATLSVTMSGTATSANFYVICSYSMALAFEKNASDGYNFMVVRGT